MKHRSANWVVWWYNPETRRWERWASGLSRAGADRKARDLKALTSRWGMYGTPTRILTEGFEP